MLRTSARASNNARHSNTSKTWSRPGDRLGPGEDLANASFYFAKLPLGEIQEDLTEFLQRPITLDILKNPTPEVVRELIGLFIAHVYNKQSEDLNQPAFGILDQIEHNELCDDHTVSELSFMRSARKLFSECMFENFGLRDLQSPERSRFQWQLSALLNYTRFRQTRQTLYDERTANDDEEIAKEARLSEAKAQSQSKISEVETARKNEEPELEALKTRINEEGLALAAQHQKQQSLTEKTHARKELLAQLHDELSTKQLSLRSEKADVARMQSKVVASPDRMRAEIENMTARLESEEEHTESVRYRNKMLIDREGGLKDVLNAMETLHNVNKDSVEKMNDVLNVKADMNRYGTKKTEHKEQMISYKGTKDQFERQIASMENRISRIDEQKEGVVNRKSDTDMKQVEDEKHFRVRFEESCRIRDEQTASIANIRKDIVAACHSHFDEMSSARKRQHQVFERLQEYEKDVTETIDVYLTEYESTKKRTGSLITSQPHLSP